MSLTPDRSTFAARARPLWILPALIALAINQTAPPAAARFVRLEGFYEFQTHINQEEGSFSPNIRTQDRADRGAKNYFEGRLYSDPHPGANLFAKLQLDSKNNDDQLRFAEAHLSFKAEGGGKGVETILFENEEKLTVQNPLLEITRSRGSKSGFEDLRGIRLNGWGWNGWVNLIHGKIRANGKDDAHNDVYAFRTGKNFFDKNRLTLAGSANSKVWASGRNSVGMMDATFRFGDAELIAEGATSHTSNVSKGQNTAFQAELRNLRAISRRLGTLQWKSAFRNWGGNYENFLGKNDQDGPTTEAEIGWFNELVYQAPIKSLRLTGKSDIKREYRPTILTRNRRRAKYWYGETYLEFRKGYAAKFFYETYADIWNTGVYRPSWLFQLESFGRYNTLKTQIKMKDAGKRYRKILFGVENNHTFIAEKLFFIVRVLHGFEDEGDFARTSMFSQLLYKVQKNGEVFLEFGNGDHGNDDLTNDGSFADNSTANTDRILKLTLKLWW